MFDKTILSQYDNMGEDYIRNQREFFANKEDWTRTKIRSDLKSVKNLKVLDIGCGAGDDLRWCEDNGIEAYGIDPSEKMCDLARETISNPDRVQIGDYENIPFPDNTFYIVIGRFSLHYLKDFSKAYTEMARVLKKGGGILLVVSHPVYDAMKVLESKDSELISVQLYDGKVVVKFPPHDISDYLSDIFFKHINLLEIDESESVDAENPYKVPETLFYKAEKK